MIGSRSLSLIIIISIMISFIPVVPVNAQPNAQPNPILTYNDSFGGTWYFYKDKVVVVKDDEALELTLLLKGLREVKLSDLPKMNVNVLQSENKIILNYTFLGGQVLVTFLFSTYVPKTKITVETKGVLNNGFKRIVFLPVFTSRLVEHKYQTRMN